MAETNPTEWPREIWMAEREEHDQGRVSAVLSEHATVARWAGDPERDREFHRYVDGDIHDSADRYWRERVAALEARIAGLEVEADGAAAIIAAERAEVLALRAKVVAGDRVHPPVEPGSADAYLAALLKYTGSFYEAAIAHGMPTGPAADAVKHVENAARGLHTLATHRDPVRDGMTRCVECQRPVDTRTVLQGGDAHVAEISDGEWVCSSGCWYAAIRRAEGGRG